MSVKSDRPIRPPRVFLAENHIAAGAVESPPSGDARLQGPLRQLGMPPTNLVEDRYRADARCGLQHRHDLAVPNPGERIGTAASSQLLLLGWF
jgi:hypothetical protein